MAPPGAGSLLTCCAVACSVDGRADVIWIPLQGNWKNPVVLAGAGAAAEQKAVFLAPRHPPHRPLCSTSSARVVDNVRGRVTLTPVSPHVLDVLQPHQASRGRSGGVTAPSLREGRENIRVPDSTNKRLQLSCASNADGAPCWPLCKVHTTDGGGCTSSRDTDSCTGHHCSPHINTNAA